MSDALSSAAQVPDGSGPPAAAATTPAERPAQPWLRGVLTEQDMLIIAGGYRCGTTSLFSYLASHPDINPSVIKEPAFFFTLRHREQPQTSYPPGDEVWAYLSLFRRRRAPVLMEGTSNYLNDPGCAERIHAALPGAKVVILLRDPVARLESWYRFLRFQHQIDPQLSIDAWVEQQLADPRATEQRPYPLQAVDHCAYAAYVESYVRVFGTQRLLPLWFDELKADPHAVTQRVCRFAGLDPQRLGRAQFRTENASSRIRYLRLFTAYRRSHRVLIRLLQPLPRCQFRFKTWLFGRFEPWLLRRLTAPADRPALSPALVRRLRAHFAADEARLAAILHSAPPWRPDLSPQTGAADAGPGH